MRSQSGGQDAEELDSRETRMTMEIRSVALVTCNRCSHEDTWSDETPEYLKFEWGVFNQGQMNEVSFDLCPACTREVKAWIRNGR